MNELLYQLCGDMLWQIIGLKQKCINQNLNRSLVLTTYTWSWHQLNFFVYTLREIILQFQGLERQPKNKELSFFSLFLRAQSIWAKAKPKPVFEH